ncbi:MAG: ABC transporter permease [Chloroflexi bacterium]|nr:ABC transporter permease [Chloroflexota bacterium]
MTWAVARFTFREAVRKKVLLGALVLSVGFLVVYALGAQLSYNDFAIHNPTMRGPAGVGSLKPVIASALSLAGLYVVNFLAGALAIFTAVGTIASEIDSGTLHAILPKPIHRRDVVLGKWLGYAIMLVIYLALMATGVLLIIYVTWGQAQPQPLLGMALMSLSTLLLLSLTILGGTVFGVLANGIVVFMLYGVGLMGGFVEQIGKLLSNDTMVNVGIVTSLIIPSDVLWKMASYVMQSQALLAQAVTTPFFGSSAPSSAMIVYAIVYTAVAVVLAVLIFNRRDL